jgi:putative Ca2+/H+ antiporter (TMEM165/GDT1 family)
MEALLVSIGVLALAEIGDKTQLLTLVLASRYGGPWPIIAGIVTATVFNHAIAGAVGEWLTGVLGPDIVRWVLAISLIAMAGWVLVRDKLDNNTGASRTVRGVFLTSAVLFFLAEIGDKTQIATVGLAARFSSLAAVVLGTTIGMVVANAPVAIFGEPLARRLPTRAVRAITAYAFAALGIGVLAFG